MAGRLALLLALGLLATSCGGDDEGGGGGEGPVVVSAAASLKQALARYGEEVAGGARFSFAGSDELAAQIRQGVRPDVFAAANTELPDALFADGLVERPRVFAGNRLVLAVPAEDARVRSLADVGEEGVTLAVGAEDVPVGTYTRAVLGRLAPAHERAVLANVRTEEPDVKGVVGKLAQGAVDAGFVYVTDVRAASGRLRAIELPARLRPTAAYAAAVVRGAERPAAARRFVAGLLSGAGARALRAAGFTPPPAS